MGKFRQCRDPFWLHCHIYKLYAHTVTLISQNLSNTYGPADMWVKVHKRSHVSALIRHQYRMLTRARQGGARLLRGRLPWKIACCRWFFAGQMPKHQRAVKVFPLLSQVPKVSNWIYVQTVSERERRPLFISNANFIRGEALTLLFPRVRETRYELNAWRQS